MIFRTASPASGITAGLEPQELELQEFVRPVRGSTHRRPTTERILGIVLWIALAMVVICVGGAS